jgi:cardiolipin synthase (CMP-forming)
MEQTVRRSHSLSLPNLLTYARLVAVPALVASMFFIGGETGRWLALIIFALAAITDFFDGYLARAWGQQSTTVQMVAICVLLAGDAASAVCRCDSITLGLVLLWGAALITLYTGLDYFRAGLKYVVYEQ